MTGIVRLEVQIGGRRVGTLERRRGRYVFEYDEGVPPEDAVSLTMPSAPMGAAFFSSTGSTGGAARRCTT